MCPKVVRILERRDRVRAALMVLIYRKSLRLGALRGGIGDIAISLKARGRCVFASICVQHASHGGSENVHYPLSHHATLYLVSQRHPPVNLISNDCNRIAEACVNFHFLWSSVVEMIGMSTHYWPWKNKHHHCPKTASFSSSNGSRDHLAGFRYWARHASW
ncbi:hypothetical protein BC936DRAFT_141316 [Jimgerdemannia flammicorona]|uniref:Uncharacterized protein n=1 Tax=Jimgerdemannia flammicorona TaxID=994334 RepID=A0A433A2E8_9FUNG|nr:hypothetical protein BC936DRAFT_141316 [Jimgerdemannia flammicorona]